MSVFRNILLSLLPLLLLPLPKSLIDTIAILCGGGLKEPLLALTPLALVSILPPFIPIEFTRELSIALVSRGLGLNIKLLNLILYAIFAMLIFNVKHALSLISPVVIFISLTQPITVALIFSLLALLISFDLTVISLLFLASRRFKPIRKITLLFLIPSYCLIKSSGTVLAELVRNYNLLTPFFIYLLAKNGNRFAIFFASMTVLDPITAILLSLRKISTKERLIITFALIIVNLIVTLSSPRMTLDKHIRQIDCTKTLNLEAICKNYSSAWIFNERVCLDLKPFLNKIDCRGFEKVILKGVRN